MPTFRFFGRHQIILGDLSMWRLTFAIIHAQRLDKDLLMHTVQQTDCRVQPRLDGECGEDQYGQCPFQRNAKVVHGLRK